MNAPANVVIYPRDNAQRPYVHKVDLERTMFITNFIDDETTLKEVVNWFRDNSNEAPRKNIYGVFHKWVRGRPLQFEQARNLGWKFVNTWQPPGDDDDDDDMYVFDSEYVTIAYPLGEQLDQEEEVGPDDVELFTALVIRYPHPELLSDDIFLEFIEECRDDGGDPLEMFRDMNTFQEEFKPVRNYQVYAARILKLEGNLDFRK